MNKKWIAYFTILGIFFGFLITNRVENKEKDIEGSFEHPREVSLEETQEIFHFYDDEDLVEYGNYLDIRCLYYDDKDIENSVWQILKKDEFKDIEVKRIEVNNQDGVNFIELRNREDDTLKTSATIIGNVDYEDEYVYLLTFPNEKFEYVGKADSLKDHENDDRENLMIKVYYKDISGKDTSEEFNMRIHRKEQHEFLKYLNECRINGRLIFRKISYLYYASLYRMDFNAWYQEMNSLLDHGGFTDATFFADEKMVGRAFHLSYYDEGSINEERLRAILDLNDEQYEKYKSLVKKAYEKGVFHHVLSFL